MRFGARLYPLERPEASGAACRSTPCESIFIKGGTLIDGTGAPGRKADLLIEGERIARISDPAAPRPREPRWWTLPAWWWPPASST